MSHFLDINDISFSIDNHDILSNINFQLARSEIATLLGPSGCGKTSLLRLIAGFSPPSTGEISMNGQLLSSPVVNIPPNQRTIGMVFQDYSLFPHLSVYDNLTFGIGKKNNAQTKKQINDLLEMIDLSDVINRYPHELSGGQQQRIAIARAIAPQPQLLLLDEPFASLDANLRERLVRDIQILLKELNVAAILVTHDQREAFALSDHIGLIHQGKILQWDTPFNIYHEPNDPFVANFVGQGVMIKAQVVSPHSVNSALGIVYTEKEISNAIGEEICMLVRPDDIIEDKNSHYTAQITHKFFHGESTLYELNYQGIRLVANVNSHIDYAVNDYVRFAIKADHLVTFDHVSGDCVC